MAQNMLYLGKCSTNTCEDCCGRVECFFQRCILSHFSRVWLFATLWTVAFQAPLSIGLSRQGYYSGLPCPPPENLPDPGTEPTVSAGRFFRLLSHRGSPGFLKIYYPKLMDGFIKVLHILIHWNCLVYYSE